MAQALPDLEDDPRVTRPDYKCSPNNPKLLLEEIVHLNVNIRFPPSVGTLLRNHYASLKHKFNLRGQKIAVVIQDYGDKLQAEPEYPKIRDLFLRNVNLNGPLKDMDERRYRNLLTLCFLPLSCDTNPPHDDWIMMVIAMTTEVIIEVLLSTASIANTEIVLKWMLEVLRPRRNFAFHVNYWLFYRWLQNYKTLRDPQRVSRLLHDPKVLTLSQADIQKTIEGPLPPSVPARDCYVVTSGNNLKTILCPNPVPHSIYGSAENSFNRDHGRSVTVKHVNSVLLHSFVINRIPTQDYKQDLIKVLIHKEYTDFSHKPIGRTMDLYGDAIAQTASYKKLLNEIKEKPKLASETFNFLLTKSIFPLNAPVTPELVITIFLLTSDIVNKLLVEKESLGAQCILVTAGCCLTQSKQMSEAVQELLLNLPYSHQQITDLTNFDIRNYKPVPEIDEPTIYNIYQNVISLTSRSTKNQTQKESAAQVLSPQNAAVNFDLQLQRRGSSTQAISAGQREIAKGDISSNELENAVVEVGFSATKSASHSEKTKFITQRQVQNISATPNQQKRKILIVATVSRPSSKGSAGTKQQVHLKASAPQDVHANLGPQIQRGHSNTRSISAGPSEATQDGVLSQAVQSVFGDIRIRTGASDTQIFFTQQQMRGASAAQAQPRKRPAAATITGPAEAQSKTAKHTIVGARPRSNQLDQQSIDANNQSATSPQFAETTQAMQTDFSTHVELNLLDASKGEYENNVAEQVQIATTDLLQQQCAPRTTAAQSQTIQVTINTQEELDLLDAIESENKTDTAEINWSDVQQAEQDTIVEARLQEVSRTTEAQSQTMLVTINTEEELDLLNAIEDLEETDLPLLSQQELDELASSPVTNEFLQYYEQLFGDAQKEPNK